MGRAPCCDKANVKKGPWSPEEDAKLKDYIERHGTGNNWIALPQKIGLKRCGKSCRLRWLNYLRPNIKHGGFSEDEENLICNLYINIGSRWSIIAAQLPGRTDNDIKNYWNTRLKKKLLGKQRKEQAVARNRVNCLKQQKDIKAASSVIFNNNFINNSTTTTTTTTTYSLMIPPTAITMPISMPSYPVSQDLGGIMMMNNNNSNNNNNNNNNHESIKKLLIKLGGRFCDDYDHHHQQNTTQQFYEENSMNSTPASMMMISSLMNTNTTTKYCSSSSSTSHDQQLLQNNNQYDIDGVANLHMLQGVLNSNGFPVDDVDEQQFMVYNNNNPTQRLEGLECFYGVDDMVINSGSSTNSAESSSNWADHMGSLVYPSLVTNDYEAGCHDHDQQDAAGLLEECAFEDSSYLG